MKLMKSMPPVRDNDFLADINLALAFRKRGINTVNSGCQSIAFINKACSSCHAWHLPSLKNHIEDSRTMPLLPASLPTVPVLPNPLTCCAFPRPPLPCCRSSPSCITALPFLPAVEEARWSWSGWGWGWWEEPNSWGNRSVTRAISAWGKWWWCYLPKKWGWWAFDAGHSWWHLSSFGTLSTLMPARLCLSIYLGDRIRRTYSAF